MLAPRVLNVALRSVERHVVGERQGGVRRNVGGESLPVLVVNPIDARAARFPLSPIDRRRVLVEIRQLVQGLVTRLACNVSNEIYHPHQQWKELMIVHFLRCNPFTSEYVQASCETCCLCEM